VEELVGVLGGAGSFSPTRRGLELVKLAALEGVESILWLSLRSEFAFMGVTSSDATLRFEAPETVFDYAMTGG